MEDDSDEKGYQNKEREFSLLTISLYKDHPELWNPKCPQYSNTFMRKRALKQMTDTLKEIKPFFNEQMLRRKINILRTNFNKEFRKRELKRRSGHDSEDLGKLWYYDALMFLKGEEYTKSASEVAEGGLYKIKTKQPKKRKLSINNEEDDDTEIIKPELQTENSEISINESFEKYDSSNDSFPAEPLVIYDKDPLVPPSRETSGLYQSLTEFDAVGINVAKKLAKMDANQAIFAEFIINNVLRRGLQHKLSDDTDLCDIGCGRVKYTLDNRILVKKT